MSLWVRDRPGPGQVGRQLGAVEEQCLGCRSPRASPPWVHGHWQLAAGSPCIWLIFSFRFLGPNPNSSLNFTSLAPSANMRRLAASHFSEVNKECKHISSRNSQQLAPAASPQSSAQASSQHSCGFGMLGALRWADSQGVCGPASSFLSSPGRTPH